MRSFSFLAASLALAALSLSSVCSHAQTAPPNALNFQGRLATPTGNPVPDANYNLRLRLYDAATGGTTLLDQSLTNIPVKNGTFAVKISGFTADKFNGNAWLGISINSGTELTPRTQIVSVPYALKSQLALSVPDGSITNSKIAAGTLTADRFAGGVLNGAAWLLNGNSGVTSGFLGTTDIQPLVFKTNNTERMRVTGDGIVGIGTTPGGNGLLEVRQSADNRAIYAISTSSLVATIRADQYGADNAIAAFGFNSTVQPVINSSAYAASNTAIRGRNLGADSEGSLGHGSVGVYGTSSTGFAGQFDGSVTVSGSVGIGTTTPKGLLDVEGDYYGTGHLFLHAYEGDGVSGTAYVQARDLTTTSNINLMLRTKRGAMLIDALRLDVFGNGVLAGILTQNSDGRWKKNVAALNHPLDDLLRLRGVSYEWKGEAREAGTQLGFIAQEVEVVLPELVKTDDKGYKSVNYIGVVPVAVEAIKALKRENDAIKAKNAALEAKLDAVMKRLEAVEAQNGVKR